MVCTRTRQLVGVRLLPADRASQEQLGKLQHLLVVTSITGYIGMFGGHLGQFSAFWLCSCLCKLCYFNSIIGKCKPSPIPMLTSDNNFAKEHDLRRS